MCLFVGKASYVDPVTCVICPAVVVAEVFVFAVPSMKVGSLDMLMALSDELGRADSFGESVVRKVERQIIETHLATSAVSANDERQNGESTPAPVAPTPFLVDGLGVHEYIKRFAWDSEQFDAKVGEGGCGSLPPFSALPHTHSAPSPRRCQEPLPELLKRLVASAERIDADLRAFVTAYTERKTALVAADRRRTGNLMVAALEDLVTPQARACLCSGVRLREHGRACVLPPLQVLEDARAEVEPPESEYLATVAVVIPKAAEEAFLASYEQARRGVVVEVFGSRLTLGLPRCSWTPRPFLSAPSQTASRAAARPSCRGPRAACSRTRTPTCSTPSPSSRSSGTPSAPPAGRSGACAARARRAVPVRLCV